MAEFEISFSQPINSSVQVGDQAYVSDVLDGVTTSTPTRIGEIKEVDITSVVVESIGSFDIMTHGPGMFFFFSKPIAINESSLKGYYADVTFKNESKKYAELFAISSEVSPSSK